MKSWGRCMGCMARWGAELEVQRTIKRAELTAFLCFLRKVCEPIRVHVDMMGSEKVRRNVLSQEQEMQTCEKLGRTT